MRARKAHVAEALCSIAGFVMLPGWALLVLAPWWRRSAGLVPGIVLSAILRVLYAALIVTNFFG